MKGFLTDDSNDIIIGNSGSITMVSGIESLAQTVKNVTRTQTGELQYDTARGIPFLETVFAPKCNLDIFKSELTKAVENLEEVTGIDSLTTEVVEQELNGNINKVLTYELKYTSIYGEQVANG